MLSLSVGAGLVQGLPEACCPPRRRSIVPALHRTLLYRLVVVLVIVFFVPRLIRVCLGPE